MFGFSKAKTQEKKNQPRLRGVLLTCITDDSVVLCKASPTIHNSYEIRLALYMAFAQKSRFILAVRPGAHVEPGLIAHLEAHGGSVVERDFAQYSVHVAHIKPSGEEGDGWVLGDAAALAKFQVSLRSDWCRQKIVVGSTLAGTDLDVLERELSANTVSDTNIDDENIRDALLALIYAAKSDGGSILVQ